MSFADLLAPETISLVIVGSGFVLLGLALFLLDVSNKAQRIFALVLILRGATFFISPLRSVAETPREATLWANLLPYAILPVVPGLVYFLGSYPTRRGLGRLPGGSTALLLVTLGLVGWYLLDHAKYHVLGPGIPPAYVGYGPLFLLQGVRLPVLALAGYVLASDYVKEPKGSRGFSLFLMVVGFTLNGLFDGTVASIDLWRQLDDPDRVWIAWEWSRWILPVAALPIALAACVRLLPVLMRSRTDRELNEVGRFFFAAVPLALVSPFILLLDYDAAPQHTTFVMGVWRLLVPILLAYALMRYQLFGIDLRIKAGVKRAILVGLFVGVFFVISQAAQALVSADKAPLFGVVSASLLAVLGKPIQTFAERAANGVMPDTQPIEKLGSQARFRLYREQFQLVQQDGAVSPKERRMLTRLAKYLGIHENEALDIELGETPTRADPPPPREPRSVSQVARTIVAVLGTAAVFGGISAVLEALFDPSSFAVGLVTAAFVALLLGPIEGLAERLTRRRRLSPAKEAALRDALRDAWADGSLSERDVAFLAALQKRLRIGKAARKRIEAEVFAEATGKPARPVGRARASG